jgi:ribosomal protein S18 acetylase RimI-like enzyme
MSTDDISFSTDCAGVDFTALANLMKECGMAHYEPDLHRRAYENSAHVVFLFQGNALVGCGRAISDQAYQAALYDIAVSPTLQGRKLGKAIVDHLMGQLKGYNVILYATPGKEDFYRKLGFRKMLSGMASFKNQVRMSERGFTE